MKIIRGKRQSGKTAEIIEQCAKDKYSLIVVPNSGLCDSVFLQSKAMGCDIPKPITFNDFIRGRFYAPSVKKFYFDELAMCLKRFTKGVPIEAVNLISDEYCEQVFLKNEGVKNE